MVLHTWLLQRCVCAVLHECMLQICICVVWYESFAGHVLLRGVARVDAAEMHLRGVWCDKTRRVERI